MTQDIPPPIVLPYSKVRIRFTPAYNKHKLAEFTRQLIVQEGLASEMRRDPVKALSGLGIQVSEDDRKKIRDDDMLAAMGHKPFLDESGSDVALWPVAIVVVAVINAPGPAE